MGLLEEEVVGGFKGVLNSKIVQDQGVGPAEELHAGVRDLQVGHQAGPLAAPNGGLDPSNQVPDRSAKGVPS
jgi:hypothetical protein